MSLTIRRNSFGDVLELVLPDGSTDSLVLDECRGANRPMRSGAFHPWRTRTNGSNWPWGIALVFVADASRPMLSPFGVGINDYPETVAVFPWGARPADVKNVRQVQGLWIPRDGGSIQIARLNTGWGQFCIDAPFKSAAEVAQARRSLW